MNVFDLILKILAAASLFAVTMVTIEDLKKQHKLLNNKKFIYGSIITMWVTGLSLVFVEQYINNKDKDEKHEADKEARIALTKVIEAQEYQRREHEIDENKADKRHSEDSSNLILQHRFDSISYSKKTNALEDTIRISREKTIASVNKIKIPNVEPFIDLDHDISPNPYADYRNDSIWFKVSITNTTQAPAVNLGYICIFINPQNDSIYIANDYHVNGNVSITSGMSETIPFWSTEVKTMPNFFYIYLVVLYSNLDGKAHQPLERMFFRHKKNFGDLCQDVDVSTFNRYSKLVYSKLKISKSK